MSHSMSVVPWAEVTSESTSILGKTYMQHACNRWIFFMERYRFTAFYVNNGFNGVICIPICHIKTVSVYIFLDQGCKKLVFNRSPKWYRFRHVCVTQWWTKHLKCIETGIGLGVFLKNVTKTRFWWYRFHRKWYRFTYFYELTHYGGRHQRGKC